MAGMDAHDPHFVHFEGFAHKAGFKLPSLLKARTLCWKKRYIRLFCNRLEYFTSKGQQGVRGTMIFTKNTYAQTLDPKAKMPVLAHARGFRHVYELLLPTDQYRGPTLVPGHHFELLLAVHNCHFIDDHGNSGNRTYVLGWSNSEEGRAARERLFRLLSAWLPCDPSSVGRVPASVLLAPAGRNIQQEGSLSRSSNSTASAHSDPSGLMDSPETLLPMSAAESPAPSRSGTPVPDFRAANDASPTNGGAADPHSGRPASGRSTPAGGLGQDTRFAAQPPLAMFAGPPGPATSGGGGPPPGLDLNALVQHARQASHAAASPNVNLHLREKNDFEQSKIDEAMRRGCPAGFAEWLESHQVPKCTVGDDSIGWMKPIVALDFYLDAISSHPSVYVELQRLTPAQIAAANSSSPGTGKPASPAPAAASIRSDAVLRDPQRLVPVTSRWGYFREAQWISFKEMRDHYQATLSPKS